MSEGDISIIRNKHSSFCHGDYGRSIGYETKYDPVPNGVLPKSGNTWRHIWAFWYLTGIPNQNRSPDHMWPASPGTAPIRLLLALPRSPKVSVTHSAEEERSMAISLYSWIRDVGTASCVSGHTFTLFIYRYLYSIISLYSYMSTWHCQVLDRWQGFQTYLSR